MYKLSLKYGSADLESSVGIHSLRSPLRTGLLQHGSWLRLLYISARIVEGPIYNGRAFFSFWRRLMLTVVSARPPFQNIGVPDLPETGR